ncbi:hypothetical protein ACR6C2_14870 [Streptomyces sp. INA 01156]
MGELLSLTTPLTEEVTVSRSTVNRRRYFEQAPAWPDGFVVVGDSVATYNPLYGQGMAVAAQGLVELGAAVGRSGLRAPDSRARSSAPSPVPRASPGNWPPPRTSSIPVRWQAAAVRERAREPLRQPAGPRRDGPCPDHPGLPRRHHVVRRPPHGCARTSWWALRGPGRKPLTSPPLTAEERRTAAGGPRGTSG